MALFLTVRTGELGQVNANIFFGSQMIHGKEDMGKKPTDKLLGF